MTTQGPFDLKLPKKTRPIIIDRDAPLEEAIRAFKSGGVIAYPTETFYGLGVDPFNPKAIENLFRLKGRPGDRPVSLIIAGRAALAGLADEVPGAAERLIERFWPGPLTVVFKAHGQIPSILTANTGKIGLRASSSPAAMRLVSALDSPITATSANPSGEKPPKTAKEVLDYFDGRLDVLMDGGVLPGRLGSTVVDVTGAGLRVIREGEIPLDEIFKVYDQP